MAPGMPIAEHEFLDDMFADAFGVPSLREVSRNFTDWNKHYVKDNIHVAVQKPGRDFEGFVGNKLTFWHVVVLGYALKRIKPLKLIRGYGRFATLIYDGILRIDVSVENVYSMWGLEISWDKTFVSSYFLIFLHNIRWQNIIINPGSRTLGKLTNLADVPIPCVTDDLEVLSATFIGAFIAGAPPLSLYGLYEFLFLDLFRRWKANSQALNLVPWCYAPKMLRGGGAQTLLQLIGKVTGDPLTERIVVRSIATRFRNQVPICNHIIRVETERSQGNIRVKLPHVLDTNKLVGTSHLQSRSSEM